MSYLTPDGEVFFNVDARTRFAALAQVPPEHLERALPRWTERDPQGREDKGPAAYFASASSTSPTAAACIPCTTARTGRAEPAHLYTAAHEHVCLRHQVWLLPAHDVQSQDRGERLSLLGLPQITDTKNRHTTWLRRRDGIADAYPVARAVTAAWWQAGAWPKEAHWPQLHDALARANPLTDIPDHVACEIVTYPDTVVLAALLASCFWQQQVLQDTGRIRPHSPADTPSFTRELARRLQRPWLFDALAGDRSGPLTAWLQACWRVRAGEHPGGISMWWLAPAHRVEPCTARKVIAARHEAYRYSLMVPPR